MKLKVPKLGWKQKVEKLRRIVLSGPAIEDLPPGMLTVLEAWRAHEHGKITDAEYIERVRDIAPPAKDGLIWEPYSDEHGEVEALYGWRFQATMFGINGQPWWLVKAHRENAIEPTDQQFSMLEKAVELLGCHDTTRDRIRKFPDDDNCWTMFWSWFHTGPLLEIHFSKTRGMLVVNEGTPLKDGYERFPRISRHQSDEGLEDESSAKA